MAGALTAAIAAAFSGGAAVVTDPYFEYTTLLLPGNGTNGAQNNTFLDGSTNNFTITRNGQTTQGTFSPFSQTGWGNYFDGTGDYLTVPDNAAFTMGSGNFTVEAFVFRSTTGARTFIFGQSDGSNDANTSVTTEVTASNKLNTYVAVGTTVYTTAATNDFPSNQWVHIAIVRSGGTISQYINGSLDGQNTSLSTLSINDSPIIFGVGSLGTYSGFWWNGYISNFRVVKGVAVYTGTFTPPTSPLAATQSAGTNISAITGTQTSLLTCQSNRFIDNSTNNFTITRNGDTRVVAFSPFNPTASWSAATYGGSGYFDGSGDYLTAPSNTVFAFGTGNLTIEAWIYVTATNSQNINILTTASPTNFAFYINSSLQFGYWNGSVVQTIGSTNAISLNTWVHVAYVRNGSTLTAYANGASVGSISDSTNLSNNKAISICAYDGATSSYTAYISNLRVIKGTAVYTGAFTPPTAPITDAGSTSAASYPSTTNVNTSFASSATSLLLNFTNAGIYDATSKNDLETVGNAQISNTTAKFGSTSMSFDGTGDWLQSPSQPFWLMSGDWTIEAWIYPNSVTGVKVLIDTRNRVSGGSSPVMYTNGTNLVIDTGAAAVISAGTVSLGSSAGWQHVAATRSGNSWRLFINGTQVGSTTTNTTSYTTAYGCTIASSFNNEYYNGYMQDVRVTKYARYTANFTPPTAAFPTL